MKTLILFLITLVSCSEKRTITTPLNDLTPAPNVEMLQTLKLQDCVQKLAMLKRSMSPLEVVALAPICPTQEMSVNLNALKEFALEKNLERVYLVEIGSSDIGFDIEGVKSLKFSISGANDLVSIENIWKAHKRDLDREVEKVVDNRLSNIHIENVVTQSRRELKKLKSLLVLLNQNEEFTRMIDLERMDKGDFPIFLSQDKCEANSSGLYLMIKPRGLFGSTVGALKNCLKSF